MLYEVITVLPEKQQHCLADLDFAAGGTAGWHRPQLCFLRLVHSEDQSVLAFEKTAVGMGEISKMVEDGRGGGS